MKLSSVNIMNIAILSYRYLTQELLRIWIIWIIGSRMTDELPRYPRLASWLWREPGLRFVHVTVSNTAPVLRLYGRKNRRRRVNEGGENTKNINTIRHLQWNCRVDVIWIDPPFKDFLVRLKTAFFKKLLIWDITI